jgi:hypothetical protein
VTRGPGPSGPTSAEHRRDDAKTLRNRAGSAVGTAVAWPLLALVWAYRRVLSPLLGVNCRFQPTCSEYASDALRQYGGIKGGWLLLGRISRCHPWGGSGYDPVPQKGDEAETRK